MSDSNFGHYSKKARTAINNFYAHADTRTLNALQEIVSDLALAEGAGADKAWAKAATLLEKAGAKAPDITRVVGAKDIKGLAVLVGGILKGR